MKHFIVKDRYGKVLRYGSCTDDHVEAQAQSGEVAEEGEYIPAPPPAQEPTYAELRYAAYPRIEDQIGAIMKGGADLEAMRAQVLDVKKLYPKD